MAFELPDLPYDYTALEPHVDEQTMHLHHDKHHATYVNNLNAALEGTDWAGRPLEDILKNLDQVPEAKRTAVRNNGGGHWNHTFFWEIMGPSGGGAPQGELASRIDAAFGGFEAFQGQFKAAALGRFGSGWAWLVPQGDGLAITSTPNQDSPIMEGVTPILGLDVWEHAYYLRYQNRRPDYVDAWWNVVDWAAVSRKAGLA